MRRLRTIPPRRLAAIIAAVAVLVATAGIAQAGLIGFDPKPAPKPLDRAIVDAFNAKAPAGVSARIEFTNGLLPSGAAPGGDPLLAGAEGRLWAAADGRMRLELQSDRGDAQIVADGERLSIYDAAAKTVYRLPIERSAAPAKPRGTTLADVRRGLGQLTRAWTLSGAEPTSTAGRPSYTLRIAPKDDGGLLGAGELAWDAERGVPLRAAVYAQGDPEPVLELEATDISFGGVSEAHLRSDVPKGTKVVEIEPPAHRPAGNDPHGAADVTGVNAVQRELDFDLSAPAELAGLPRKQVRLLRLDGRTGALALYGEGLGGIAVLQHRSDADRDGGALESTQLPQVNIDGATGTELATALGTMLTFERGGVRYTVLGSVPPVAAENAARDLR